MKAIAIFTLVICCIGVESLPGVREKRETKNCSSLVVPRQKIYQIFYTYERVGKYGEKKGAQSSWEEARVACQDLGGDLAEPSTREEENKIIAAIDKAEGDGTLLYYWRFWIGLQQLYDDSYNGFSQWVSGEKIERQDSDLKLTPLADWTDGGCGTIEGGGDDREGITFTNCGKGSYVVGYLCEFDDPSRLPFPVIA